MRYLSLAEVIELHRRVVDQSGGASGLRYTGRLESAVAQPRISFGGRDLYPSLIEKPARYPLPWCKTIRLSMGISDWAMQRWKYS